MTIFSRIVWIDKSHDCDEIICFPNNGCHGNRKKDTFSVIIATVTKRKMFHQKPKCYRCILPMKKVSWLDKYSPVIISSPIALVHLHARLDVLTTVFATSFCFINTTHAFFIFIIVKIYFLLNLFHSVNSPCIVQF